MKIFKIFERQSQIKNLSLKHHPPQHKFDRYFHGQLKQADFKITKLLAIFFRLKLAIKIIGIFSSEKFERRRNIYPKNISMEYSKLYH
jgi:hypothetical protein